MNGRSPDARPVGWREQVLHTDLCSSAVHILSLTTPHLPPSATHQLSVRRIACSGSGTKNVSRLDRTDVVPGRNSTGNSSGTITTHMCDRWTNGRMSQILSPIVTLKTLTYNSAGHLFYINHQIPPSSLYSVVAAFHRGVYAVSTTGLSVSYTRYTASVASECTYVVRL